jgi:hypothetical protein
VQREDEVSAPFDMSEISPGDDWYVAVNGVPVGPIRIAEVRRKAALGAVTEDSLVWQEGLDEWRPLRTFPELAATVREAALSGRASMTPPPSEARPSIAPPPRTGATRPITASVAPAAARVASVRPNQLVAPLARSNVVPITSRLATAEKLEEPPQAAPPRSPFVPPATAPVVAAAAAVSPASILGAAAVSSTAAATPTEVRRNRPVPWIAIGMVLMCVAFGTIMGLNAIGVLGPRSSSTPAIAAAAGSAPGPSAAPSAVTPPAISAAAADSVAPAPVATAPSGAAALKNLVATAGPKSPAAATAAATPSATGRSLDLHGLAGSTTIAPTDDMNSDGPKAAGQCFSEGQVSQVIGQHQVAIRRACWERNASNKSSANVSVSLTIGADGTAQNVSASGDDPTVAHCIENDVRNWRFPSMGCSQKIAVPFKFVRQ